MKDIQSWSEILYNHARNRPNQIAVYSSYYNLTYRELSQNANQVSNYLISKGLKKGDRIGILCDKTPEFVIISLACSISGFILTPLNYRIPHQEMEFVLQLTHPTFLFGQDEHWKAYLDILDKWFTSEQRVILDDSGNQWTEMLSQSSMDPPHLLAEPEDPVYLNFTSGTTGTPKAALTTGSVLYWNTRGSVETLEMDSEDILMSLFPVYGHPHELWCRPVYLGGAMVLLNQTSPRSVAKALSDYKVTVFMAVPSLMNMLVTLLEEDGDDFDFSHLRILEAGGMHSTEGLTRRIKDKFTVFNSQYVPVWGSTETAGIALCSKTEPPSPLGSVGLPVKYYEAKVVDEKGMNCAPDEIGELAVRGPGVISSYFQNEEENNHSFKEGWYHTGDLFKKDENGFFYFVYRRQGMMKVAGLKVSPQEIDNVLSLHPDIQEAICVPAYDPLRGEIPKALIVCKEGKNLSQQDIKKFCRSYLAEYKIPRQVEFWDFLPKTPTGKLDIRRIKEMVQAGLNS